MHSQLNYQYMRIVDVLLSEVKHTHDRRQLRKKIKRLQELGLQLGPEEERVDNGCDMVRGYYHTAGDKHRLTLVNLSYVKNWFKPKAQVEWGKPKCILLVFSSTHVRSED